jgi:hypothetical protein
MNFMVLFVFVLKELNFRIFVIGGICLWDHRLYNLEFGCNDGFVRMGIGGNWLFLKDYSLSVAELIDFVF